MKRFFLSTSVGLLTLVGLAGAATPAKADHEHREHHRGYHRDRDHDRWRHEYRRDWPYRSYYYAPLPAYSPPPVYTAPCPSYGVGYQGPQIGLYLGR